MYFILLRIRQKKTGAKAPDLLLFWVSPGIVQSSDPIGKAVEL